MPKVSQMIESKYLRKEDVDGEALVTVRKVGQVNVALEDAQPEMKWAVRFDEFKKPMILNSTNIQLLEKTCGSDDSDAWTGKKVVIYVDDNVSFGGKLVGGLRIKAHREQAAPKAPAAAPGGGGKFDDLTDDIPF